MISIWSIAALAPVFWGLLMGGDFTQKFYKPPRRAALWTYRYRWGFIGLSAMLLSFGFWQFGGGSHTWALTLTTMLAVFFAFAGFFVVPYVIFPTFTHRIPWKPALEISSDELSDNDEVIGLEINGDARAYPVSWIVRPHVVHDTVGGEPIAMTYCGLSHLARSFGSKENNGQLRFQVYLQIENNLVLYDNESHGFVQQIEGTLDGGKSAGRQLTEYPSRIMSWKSWRNLYPHTRVFYNPACSSLDRGVRRLVQKILGHQFNADTPYFPTIKRFDSRLHPKAPVIGLLINGRPKAYGLDFLRKHMVINDTVAGKPVLVVHDPVTEVTEVFQRPEKDGGAMEIDAASSGHGFKLFCKATGTEWNIKGEVVKGDGQALQPKAHASKILWMIWYNFYPHTELAFDRISLLQ